MKKFLFLLFLIPFLSYNQNIRNIDSFNPKATAPLYTKVETPYNYFFSHNDKLMLIKYYKSWMDIKSLDLKTMKLNKKFIKPTEMIKGYRTVGFHQVKNEIIIFYNAHNNLTEKFYYRKIDISNQDLILDERLIFEETQKIKINNHVSSSFTASHDESKYLFVYELESDDKKPDVSRVGITVLDSDFNIKWSKSFYYPYTKKNKFLLKGVRIDNNGNVYFLALVREPSKKYEVLKFSETSGDTPEIILFYEGENAREDNVKINILKDNTVVIHAYLSEEKKELINVEKMMLINGNGQVISNKTARLWGSSEDNKISIPYLMIKEIKPTEDGGFLSIGEIDFSTGNFIYNNELFILKYNNTGKLMWSKKINKFQSLYVTNQSYGVGITLTAHYGEMGEMSYNLISKNDYHYVFFMDHPDNALHSENDKPIRFGVNGKGNLTAFVLSDKTGELISKNVLYSRGDVMGINTKKFNISKILLTDKLDVVVELENKKEKQFILKISLAD
jgi:hypothetical protein